MNDKFTQTTNDEESVSERLKSAAKNIEVSPAFKAQLEQQLMDAYKPAGVSVVSSIFNRTMPALGLIAALALMVFVLNWMIRSVAPPPIPAAQGTTTPAAHETASPTATEYTTLEPENAGYDWRGTKLYLSQSLPQLPDVGNVYILRDEEPATIEFAKALADIFGISGGLYETPNMLPNAIGYLATDGKQRLYIESESNYKYYADYSTFSFLSGGKNITDEQASVAIEAFMNSHGMDFDYQIERGPQIPGLFYVLPLTPDGRTIRYDYNIPFRLEFTVDDSGQVIVVSFSRVDYDLVGAYGIRSAEDAFQQVLNASGTLQNGVLETMRSSGVINESFWEHKYPDNRTVTIYGQPLFYPAAEEGGAPFAAIGQHTAVGNIAGLQGFDTSIPIQATGQFSVENGIRIFTVETWTIAPSLETSLSGFLRRAGDQIILAGFDGGTEYVIDDAPADLPLNTTTDEYLSVNGFLVDGKMNWTSIQYLPAGAGGGGGGGGGSGFYKLNLSGTPVPFPSLIAEPESNQGIGDEYTVKEGDTLLAIAQAYGTTPEKIYQANSSLAEEGVLMVGMKLIIPYTDAMPLERWEGQRGILSVTIWEQADGGQRVQYGFITNNQDFPYLLLEGNGLEVLQQYNSRPVDVWGTVGNLSQDRMPLLNVERFEIPFPDLQFQIMKGSEKSVGLNEQTVLLFTDESGKQYVELAPNCYHVIGPESVSGAGREGEPILLEALPVPDLTFGGYPAICVFSEFPAVDPSTNQSYEPTITAGQISILPEPPKAATGNLPTATIEKVELVYYTPSPRLTINNPSAIPAYVQPVWRFYGHYSSGDEFEFLVQALKQEYLLPELIEAIPPG